MDTLKTTFDNGRGQQLSAILDRPVEERTAAHAIFAHCFTCSKSYKAVRHISRALAKEGFAVLSFDFTGLGESEGDFAETSFTSNVDDVVAAAVFLTETHGAPTVLIGHSLGGAAVMMAAPRIPSASAVVTIAAPASLDHLSEILSPVRAEVERAGSAEILLAGRRIRIGRELMNDLGEVRMGETISDLGRALLVMHSPVDSVVGIDNASTIFRAAKYPKSFVSLDRADHLLGRPEDSRYAAGVIAAWVRKYTPEIQGRSGATGPGDHR